MVSEQELEKLRKLTIEELIFMQVDFEEALEAIKAEIKRKSENRDPR